MSSDRSALARALAELHDVVDAAALNPERWSDFIDLLEAHAGGTKILFQAFDRECTRWTPMLSRGFSDRTLHAYATYFAPISPWRDLLENMEPGQAVWGDQYVPVALLHQTEFYNDLLRPEGAADSSTGLNVFRDHRRQASLAVHYSSHHAERMNARVMPLLSGLAVRMRQALDVNRARMQSSTPFEGDASLLQSLTTPGALVDSKGRVLAANQALLTWVDRSVAIRIRARDLLDFGPAEYQHRFLSRLQDKGWDNVDGARQPLGDLIVDYPEGSFAVSLLPIRLEVQDLRGVAALFPTSRRFLVLFRPRERQVPDKALEIQLARRFHLTAAEIRLVLGLAQGESINGLAASLGVSHHTLRAQMRSVFAKTDTNRQVELIALVTRMLR